MSGCIYRNETEHLGNGESTRGRVSPREMSGFRSLSRRSIDRSRHGRRLVVVIAVVGVSFSQHNIIAGILLPPVKLARKYTRRCVKVRVPVCDKARWRTRMLGIGIYVHELSEHDSSEPRYERKHDLFAPNRYLFYLFEHYIIGDLRVLRKYFKKRNVCISSGKRETKSIYTDKNKIIYWREDKVSENGLDKFISGKEMFRILNIFALDSKGQLECLTLALRKVSHLYPHCRTGFGYLIIKIRLVQVIKITFAWENWRGSCIRNCALKFGTTLVFVFEKMSVYYFIACSKEHC